MGDIPDTRRTLVVNNFGPPGSASSLRRTSQFDLGLRSRGVRQLSRSRNKGSPRFGLLSGNLVLAPATKGAPKRAAAGARLAYKVHPRSACLDVGIKFHG